MAYPKNTNSVVAVSELEFPEASRMVDQLCVDSGALAHPSTVSLSGWASGYSVVVVAPATTGSH